MYNISLFNSPLNLVDINKLILKQISQFFLLIYLRIILVKYGIVGIIKIKKDNLKQKIINSYENVKREETSWNWDEIKVNENEEEIKNCDIFINGKKIKFTYYYNFPNDGKYIIKYEFKNLIKSTSFMFYGCNSLLWLDLSNFNRKMLTTWDICSVVVMH